MNKYIKDWHNLILNCSFDNTYKMAWAKSLIELASTADEESETVTFYFDDISKHCLKHYWNQTIYFNLIQGSNIRKPPELLTITKVLISAYFSKVKRTQPVRFEKINFLKLKLEDQYSKALSAISNTLRNDVCWRFKNLNGFTFELYELDRCNRTVTFSMEQIHSLKKYSDYLFPLINYRWTQMLEGFNFSPKISRKVRAIDDDKIKRSSLRKFYKYLDLLSSNGVRKCFYCDKEIPDKELSVDHVIPWSFMFSDDIWNLVYYHKSENSEKSNHLPTEEDIAKLEKRNTVLLSIMRNTIYNKSKDFDQLQLANEHDYVRSFWISFKG